ncbi:hypothetical protein C8F01DRAFT_1157129 [Mycena amicta]|nr:hypothetical protein C8F01DRAFT_1157129 [Mycena amicta]
MDTESTLDLGIDWSGDTPNEEAGAAKLWTVYVNEAEKYDKSLVESWKSDMDGMLIFAGLFSASLTAFLMESYKTLASDSGDEMVHFLSQISRQMSAAANNTTYAPTNPSQFEAPLSALICNALWFISLGLSLACALVATLLEQWARDFLHRADMHSSPIIRARIYSYLYYGLRRFRMHTVVDVIPSLLHAALVFFFGGLVAFLYPVNKIIAALAGAILALFVGVYITLSVLPLLHFDCPYRTPLSNAIWHFFRDFWVYFLCRCWSWSDLPTMPAIIDNVITGRKRDVRALIWTVTSLSDDHELETFVEAIPDAMWGPATRNRTYTDYVKILRDSRELDLSARIADLFRSCNDGFLLPDLHKRRSIACLKAIWAVASIPDAPLSRNSHAFSLPPGIKDFMEVLAVSHGGDDIDPYYVSARAMVHWSALQWLKVYLNECAKDFQNVAPDSAHLKPVLQYLEIAGRSFLFQKDEAAAEKLTASTYNLFRFRRTAKAICSLVSHSLFFDYLQLTASSSSMPYRWRETLSIIAPTDFGAVMEVEDLLAVETTLDITLESISSHGAEHAENRQKTTALMQELCYYWRPDAPRFIPAPIIRHLHSFDLVKHPLAVEKFIYDTKLESHLWLSFAITLQLYTAHPDRYDVPISEVLEAIWLAARFGSSGPSEGAYHSVLKAAVKCDSAVVPALVTMLAKAVLDGFVQGLYDLHPPVYGAPPPSIFVLPAQTAHEIPTNTVDRRVLYLYRHKRAFEARISLLAEFIEYASSTDLLSKAAQTVEGLGDVHPLPECAVHPAHQTRFARAVLRLSQQLDSDSENQTRLDMMRSVIWSKVFYVYSLDPITNTSDLCPWLEEASAREDIRGAFLRYRDFLTPGQDSARISAIVEGLETHHLPRY